MKRMRIGHAQVGVFGAVPAAEAVQARARALLGSDTLHGSPRYLALSFPNARTQPHVEHHATRIRETGRQNRRDAVSGAELWRACAGTQAWRAGCMLSASASARAALARPKYLPLPCFLLPASPLSPLPSQSPPHLVLSLPRPCLHTISSSHPLITPPTGYRRPRSLADNQHTCGHPPCCP
eukprot:2934602-Rhodomonas_salina.1